MIKSKEIRFLEGGGVQFGTGSTPLFCGASIPLPYGSVLLDILIYYAGTWGDAATLSITDQDDNSLGTIPFTALHTATPVGKTYSILQGTGSITNPTVDQTNVRPLRPFQGNGALDFSLMASVTVTTGGSLGGDTRIIVVYDEPAEDTQFVCLG